MNLNVNTYFNWSNANTTIGCFYILPDLSHFQTKLRAVNVISHKQCGNSIFYKKRKNLFNQIFSGPKRQAWNEDYYHWLWHWHWHWHWHWYYVVQRPYLRRVILNSRKI